MKRELRFFDILCIGVNAIVGSGIFLIPGRLIGGMGPASILLYVVCGLMLIPVGLCFAEASSRTDRSGGSYIYVEKAFGHGLGFATGWIDIATALFSYPAAAIGLPKYLATFFPIVGQGIYPYVIAGIVIVLLAAINIRGIRPGATTVNIFTVSKLVPLLILIGVGAWFFKPSAF
ncbi:MAG TPA: amino acid permease, partial [bacterium]|nr:amino acid permease [bacterium]